MSFRRRFFFRSRGKKKVFRNVLFWFAVGTTLSALLFEQSIRPIVSAVVSHRVHNEMTAIVNSAAAEILRDETVDYTVINKNTGGELVSIETNSSAVNRFQTLLTEKVLAHLTKPPEFHTEIPFGTLTGIQLFSGYGPPITVKVIPIGSIEVTSESRLTGAGINQTVHQLVVRTRLSAAAVLPGFTSEIEIENEYILSETLVIGTVPNIYAQNK